MSESKTLADVLKGAPEVTSLASADRILAVDANGNQKKISKGHLRNEGIMTSKLVAKGDSGWLRIANLSANSSAIVKISVAWGSIMPAMVLFGFFFHPNGGCNIKPNILMSSSSVLDSARFVRKRNSLGYLDIKVPITATENFSVEIIAPVGVTLTVGDATDAAIPEGFNTEEYSLVGGGKTLRFNQLRRVAERRAA